MQEPIVRIPSRKKLEDLSEYLSPELIDVPLSSIKSIKSGEIRLSTVDMGLESLEKFKEIIKLEIALMEDKYMKGIISRNNIPKDYRKWANTTLLTIDRTLPGNLYLRSKIEMNDGTIYYAMTNVTTIATQYLNLLILKANDKS